MFNQNKTNTSLPCYFMASCACPNDNQENDYISKLLRDKVFAFSKNLGWFIKRINPNDWICFYQKDLGVVAYAQIFSIPDNVSHPLIDKEKYPFMVYLYNVYCLKTPTIINKETRLLLDAFKEKKINRWAWFVQSPRNLYYNDFLVLTQQKLSSLDME